MIDASLKTDVASAPKIPLSTKLGPVHIAVTERDKALAIWRDVVGLTILAEDAQNIVLGAGGVPLIVLEPGAERAAVQRSLGLYHVAIHVPSRADLAHMAVRALLRNVRISPTDHLVSEAIYLWDLDGNGIEITFETPWRGRLADPETGHYAITAKGRPHSGRDPIDLEGLLAEIDSRNPEPVMPAGTRIGHIHVHVSDLDRAMDFYRDALGFAGFLLIRSFGMGDVGLDYMPHTIAFNIWSGPRATQPPAGSAGLRYFTIALPDEESREAVRARLVAAGSPVSEKDGDLWTEDPFGNRIRLSVFAPVG
jgi:catechol 2,3-dioxygenase